MKQLWIIVLLVLASVSFSQAKEREDKTFLVIFDKQELKKIKSSSAYIELNFFEKFKTKSYSGNSDEALMITIPSCDWDECEMGKVLVQVNRETWVPLQEIAFRIIDLNESKESFQYLLSHLEDTKNSKKKSLTVRINL